MRVLPDKQGTGHIIAYKIIAKIAYKEQWLTKLLSKKSCTLPYHSRINSIHNTIFKRVLKCEFGNTVQKTLSVSTTHMLTYSRYLQSLQVAFVKVVAVYKIPKTVSGSQFIVLSVTGKT